MRERIGSYRIEQILGKGGMGVVYKGCHDGLGRHAAIKTFLPTDATDSELRKRLLAEAQAQARLQHPNIVAVYDLFEDQGELFIAMEYVEGKTLADLLKERRGGRMSLDEALRVLEQILDALEYVHSRGIIHRDIKPSNVMVCSDQPTRVKLMDFGIARLAGTPRMTSSLRVLGTPPYMSPEQLQAKEVDQRSDLYSAAVVFYRVVSGRLPFESQEYLAQIHERIAGPPDLQSIAPDVPAGVCKAIAIALHPEPNERFPNAAELRNALHEGAIGFLPTTEPQTDDEPTTVVTPDRADEPTPPPERNWRKAFTAVWIVILIAFAAGIYALVDKLSEPFPEKVPPLQAKSLRELPFPRPQPEPQEEKAEQEKRRPEPKKDLPVVVPTATVEPKAQNDTGLILAELGTEIHRLLLRANHDLTFKPPNCESAMNELITVEQKIAPHIRDFPEHHQELNRLRARARECIRAEDRRKDKEAAWASHLAQIEKHLQKNPPDLIEAARIAQLILNDQPPEPFAARASEALKRVENARANGWQGARMSTTTNELVIRQPSSPPRKDL